MGPKDNTNGDHRWMGLFSLLPIGSLLVSWAMGIFELPDAFAIPKKLLTLKDSISALR